MHDYNIVFFQADDINITSHVPEPVWPLIDLPAATGTSNEMLLFNDSGQANFTLPFAIRYQLEVCISQGVFNEHNLDAAFVARLATLAQQDERQAQNILEHFAEQENRVFEPLSIFDIQIFKGSSTRSKVPHYCAYSRKATVTPTTIIFSTPTVETTNRVIRRFAGVSDRFLRVQFTDEKYQVRFFCSSQIHRI